MEWLIGVLAAAIPFAILVACPVGMFLAMRFGMNWTMPGRARERDLIEATRSHLSGEPSRAARA